MKLAQSNFDTSNGILDWKTLNEVPEHSGVDFTNIFLTAFTCTDHKSTIKTDGLNVILPLFGSTHLKGALKTLVKLIPVVNFINVFEVHFSYKFLMPKLQSWLLGLKFWRQKFHIKTCTKMLMKLTPGGHLHLAGAIVFIAFSKSLVRIQSQIVADSPKRFGMFHGVQLYF